MSVVNPLVLLQMVQEYQYLSRVQKERHVNNPWLNTAGLYVNWHRDASSANVTRIIHHMLKCTLDLVGSAQPDMGAGGKLTLLHSAKPSSGEVKKG